MPRFTFRLERLLKIRRTTRDERQSQLARAYEAERVLEQQQVELDQQRTAIKQMSRNVSGPGTVNVETLLGVNRYELVLESQGRVLRERGQQLEAEIQKRRQSLINADRDVRVLEKLRERQQIDHANKERRLEIKQTDDAVQRTDSRHSGLFESGEIQL